MWGVLRILDEGIRDRSMSNTFFVLDPLDDFLIDFKRPENRHVLSQRVNPGMPRKRKMEILTSQCRIAPGGSAEG